MVSRVENTTGDSWRLATELPYYVISPHILCDMAPFCSLYILRKACIACHSIYGLQIAEGAPHTKLKLNFTADAWYI